MDEEERQASLQDIRQFLETECTTSAADNIMTGILMSTAARQGHMEAIQLLVDAGASPDMEDIEDNYHWRVPLHFAAASGHLAIVKYLVDQGATIDYVDADRITPLHEAAAAGHVDIAAYLLDKGASTELVDCDSYTALQPASCMGHVDMCLLLLQYIDVNKSDKDGWTALHAAVEYGHANLVEHFIKAGANVNMRTKVGQSPLLLAAKKDHLVVVKQLLACGADIDAATKQGRTPLYESVDADKYEVCKLLINMGANPNKLSETGSGRLIFFRAVLANNIALVKLLLEGGYNIQRNNWLRSCPSSANKSQLRYQMWNLIRSPYTLRAICILQIRALLGPNKSAKAWFLLSLPAELRNLISRIE